ncbi:MAG: hypothetical protein B7Z02_10220 [Rhodobacterales bacterium 32-67-9]|nr:MAG: hypothetical protein B7Z02_10220 [Rhodobacterales bacterium 32-67-9]
MTCASLHPPRGDAAHMARTFAAVVPEFRTERLVLRAPRLDDYPAYETVFRSDRARHMGGPFDAAAAFADFCQGVAGWLLRGAGMWTICRHGEDAPLGWLSLWQEFNDPEPELGWVLCAPAEGQGYAHEAASAVLPHATALYGAGGFVSYVGPDNLRSARLAERLGARRDHAAERALGNTLLVYRHMEAENRK